MEDKYEKFKNCWETYNGFALIAMILGVLCLFFGWFKAGSSFIYIKDLLYIDRSTSLLGLLYFLGFIFLVFYYIGSVLSNFGAFGTPFEKQSRTFFILSVFLFIYFMGLMYFYFDQGTACFGHGYIYFYCLCHWKIHIGFILGAIMTGMMVVSFGYEIIMLRRHYQEHLPEYTPL